MVDSYRPPLNRNPDLIEVSLERLKLRAQLGVYAHERGRSQPLVVSVRAWARISPTQDDLSETIDYNMFAHAARELGAERHFDLVESYIAALADRVMADSRIVAAEVRAEKPEAIAGAAGAGAAVFRARPD